MMRCRNAAALSAMLLALSLAGPALARGAKQPKCFPREGHCVAVVVNGQAAVPLTKPTQKALKSLEGVSHYVDDTRYEVPEPIRGELEVAASLVAGAESQLGEGGGVDVQIVPLEEVEIETRQQLVAEPSVRIDGQVAVGVGHFLEDGGNIGVGHGLSTIRRGEWRDRLNSGSYGLGFCSVKKRPIH